jgi:hypothetical protein
MAPTIPPTRPITPRPTPTRAATPTPARPQPGRPLTPAAPPYRGVALPELGSAVGWKPGEDGLTGAEANETITGTYHALDQAMSRYLGTPTVPNWMTFGKYASRQAGEQIVRLEEMLKIAKRLQPDAMVDTLQDFAKHPEMLGEQGLALLKLSDGPLDMLRNAQLIRDALVIGNTGVYVDIAPAYDLFLRTEAAGGDGVAALKAGGWGKAPRDPQGLILPAFALYQRAAREKKALTPEAREALVHRANMLIVSHEQMVVVQGPRVFGDPRVARLMGSLTSQMTVTDVRGSEALLPNGGNWADFATRMGYADAPAGTPGAIRVTDAAGRVHHYVPNPDPARRVGTIGSYFEGALGEADAKAMIGAAPAPLPPAYGDGSDLGRAGRRWFTGIATQLRKAFSGLLARGLRAFEA